MKLSHRARQALLVTGGTLALGAGIAGMLVPVLPTTPFLLLAAACYLRSSRRLYRWLMNSRVPGSYLRDYYEHRCMKRRVKLVTVALLWITIGISCFLSGFNPLVCGLLMVVAVGVTIHIVLLRASPPGSARTGEERVAD